MRRTKQVQDARVESVPTCAFRTAAIVGSWYEATANKIEQQLWSSIGTRCCSAATQPADRVKRRLLGSSEMVPLSYQGAIHGDWL